MEVVVRLSSRGRKYQDWFQNVLFLERWGLVYRIVCTGTRYGLFLWSNHGQLFFFFFSPSHMLSSPFFFSLPLSRNSDPGSHSRLFSPPPHYVSPEQRPFIRLVQTLSCLRYSLNKMDGKGIRSTVVVGHMDVLAFFVRVISSTCFVAFFVFAIAS